MNISENKRVAALAAVFALAFGGVMFYGYGESQKHAENQKMIEEINMRFDRYNNQELTPTKQNLKEIKAAFSQVAAVNKDLRAELNGYREFCLGDGKRISSLDFLKELQQGSSEIVALANKQGATLGGSAENLGMGAFIKSPPMADDVPFRSFQHKAVKRVAEIILNSGAPKLEKIYCEALPEEAAASLNAKSRKGTPYFPLRFEVGFEVSRGALPKVMNAIMADKNFFLTVTGIAMENKTTPMPMDAYSAPADAASSGADFGADGAGAAAEPADRVIAVQKTGTDKERVYVYMMMQVLYFTPEKIK